MEFYIEKFREIKERKGITGKELCRLLYISRTTLWKWENQKAAPSPNSVRLLAKILKINVEEISSLLPEAEYEPTDYTEAAESCNSLLDREIFSIKNERLQNAINEILSLQKELDQTSLILNAVFNEMSSIFYIKDINLKYIAANKKFLQNLSLHSSYRVYGKEDQDFFSSNEAKINSEQDKNVLTKGKAYRSEGYILGSRKKRWGIIEKYPILNENGKVTGLISTCKDITEQKIAEAENKKLLAEKDILFTAVNNLDRAIVLVYERTKNGKPVYSFISNNIEKILGYSKSYLKDNGILLATLLHEEQRDKLVQHFMNPKTEIFNARAQVMKNNGTYIWMEIKAQKRTDANGNFSFLGILSL